MTKPKPLINTNYFSKISLDLIASIIVIIHIKTLLIKISSIKFKKYPINLIRNEILSHQVSKQVTPRSTLEVDHSHRGTKRNQ